MNITFNQTSLTVEENVGYIEIILMKTDGARGPVTITLTPNPGTAVGEYNYKGLTLITFSNLTLCYSFKLWMISTSIKQKSHSAYLRERKWFQ